MSLRTMKNGFDIDVKTQDNVTIGLEVSAQYHVSYEMGTQPSESGVYKSYYMLQQPVAQMRDFITDALRSSIPVYTLDEVFAKKDDIAKDVNATVSEQMDAYGFTLVSTLITKIALPAEVEDSMNQINAAQRTKAAAQDLAEADRIRRVTEARAEAEAMEKAGEGIANQRKAIAIGIKDSLETIQETGVGNAEANQLFMFTQWTEMMNEFAKSGRASTVVLPTDEGIANQRKAIAIGIKDSLETIQETGVGNAEANQLFMFTQWTEMMNEFAKSGRASTVVLPTDFTQSAGMFEQMLAASQAVDAAPVPQAPPIPLVGPRD